jgi:hypothetical protein
MYLDQDFYRSFYRDLKHLERIYLTRPLAENVLTWTKGLKGRALAAVQVLWTSILSQ